jgi:hypothetical protein
MAKPQSLSPGQQAEVRRRRVAGEGVRALAREFGVAPSTISKLCEQSEQVRTVAEQVAAAQTALAALPVAQQHEALSLADKLRSISDNLAAAAMHGAATAHRLNALANAEVAKVDDADPLSNMDALRGVGVLSKLANESASVALNLLAANKPTVEKINAARQAGNKIDPSKLSDAALEELARVMREAKGSHAD